MMMLKIIAMMINLMMVMMIVMMKMTVSTPYHHNSICLTFRKVVSLAIQTPWLQLRKTN